MAKKIKTYYSSLLKTTNWKEETKKHQENMRKIAPNLFEKLRQEYSIVIDLQKVQPMINKRGNIIRATYNSFFEFTNDMKTLKVYNNMQILVGRIDLTKI